MIEDGPSWPIDRIMVLDRVRSDLGSLTTLAASIAEIGLLHPVVVRPDGRLIAGERRLAACRELGMENVPVRILDIEAIVRGEADENSQRLPFTPEEAVKIYDAVIVEAQRLARERMKAGAEAGGSTPVGKKHLDQEDKGVGISHTLGKSRDDAAAYTGYSEKSLRGAREVLGEAKREPGVFDPIRVEMNETRNINRAVSAVRRIHRERALARQRQPGFGRVLLVEQDAVEFLKSLEPNTADLLLTDPPYSTDVEDIWSFAEWVKFGLKIIKPTGRFYIFTGAYPDELAAYAMTIRRCMLEGWTLDNVLVWTYRNTMGPAPTNGYKLNWQACFYGYGPEAPPLDCPSLNEQFTVHDINAPDARSGVRLHAWEKPRELATRLIVHSTKPGQMIVDPFAGTGAFVAAAEELGRDVMACDVSREMLNLCAKRGLEVSGEI